MKHQIYRIALSGLLATGLTLGSAAAFAQQDNAAPAASAQAAPAMGHKHQTPDEQVAHMTKRYSLTADQQAQIKPILANQQEQMQALRQDATLSRDDKRAKAQSIHADSTNKIQALLNDTQKQKFAQDQQKREQRMQQRNGAAAPANS
jgi:Spy/CpxP family protein refolding chaperone